jgi:hypothetical protein
MYRYVIGLACAGMHFRPQTSCVSALIILPVTLFTTDGKIIRYTRDPFSVFVATVYTNGA